MIVPLTLQQVTRCFGRLPSGDSLPHLPNLPRRQEITPRFVQIGILAQLQIGNHKSNTWKTRNELLRRAVFFWVGTE